MKGNLILSSLLFLPYLQNSTTELLTNLLDDFIKLKDFTKTQNDILYKERNTEDEIVEAIENIIQEYDKKKETKDMDDKGKLSHFETKLRASIQSENEGGMIELATKIAEDNGYVCQRELSNHNAKFKIEYTKNKRKFRTLGQSTRRNIFKSTNTDKLVIYLSLDFENFQYEVCDENGKHQGVWNLSGRNTADADNSGEHNIITNLSMT